MGKIAQDAVPLESQGADVVEGKQQSLFANRNFLFLWLARVISSFGDSLDSIAFAWLVFQMTGSPAMMGIVFAVNGLPNLLFAIPGGLLADRVNRKALAVFGNFGRAVVVSSAALLYMAGLLEVWMLFVMTFMVSTLEALTEGGESALIVHILKPRDMMRANGSMTSGTSIAQLVGLALAGGMVALLGPGPAILIDGVTFALGGIFLSFLQADSFIPRKTIGQYTMKRARVDTALAFRFVKGSVLVLFVCSLGAGINAAFTPINVLNVVYVQDSLGLGAVVVSVMGVAQLVGMAIGGGVTPKIAQRWSFNKLFKVGMMGISLAYVGTYLPTLVSADWLKVGILGIISLVMGFCLTMLNIPVSTLFQTKVPKNMQGRVGGFLGMLIMAGTPMASALSGFVSNAIGVVPLFLVLGAIMILVSVMIKMPQEGNESFGS